MGWLQALTGATVLEADNSANAGSGGRGGNTSSGTGGGGGSGGFGQGGGLYSIFGSSSGEDSLFYSTVAGNTVQGGAGGAGGAGSSGSGGAGSPGIAEGLSIETVFGGLFLVYSNILGTGPGANCAGHPLDLIDLFNNLDSGTSCHLTSGFFNTDPLLGPLANNGGPTQTLALLPGSPAIDVYPDRPPHSGCAATDQRGVSRPQPPRRELRHRRV